MTTIVLPVPVSPGPGAWVSAVALLGAFRTFQAAGDSMDDLITIEGSLNQIDSYQIMSVRGAGNAITTGDQAPFYRAVRTAGTGAGFAGVASAFVPAPAGPAGPPALGQLAWSGNLTTTDAAPTPVPSAPQSTAIGAFGPAGFIPTLDGTYSVLMFGSLFIAGGPDIGSGSEFFSAASFTVSGGVVTTVDVTNLVGSAMTPATDGSVIEILATGILLDTIDWTHNSTIQYVG